jgi:predicted Ser/Thr protein kinase
MGEVYRARDSRLNRDVALKILPAEVANDPVRRQRFEQEARALAALNHPNIVAIYDVGEANSIYYIISELVDGEPVRGAQFGLRKTIEIAVQITSGLGAAHDAGVVHRDLKPDNILLTRDGRPKILDFGLAKMHGAHTAVAAATETLTVRTEPGVVMGTVGYMSPEQVRGLATDPRSDIFSFGVILHELLTGKRAFQGETSVDTMQAILRREPPDLPANVPAGIRQIVQHCLEKDPAQRFHSARDVGFALAAVSHGGSDSVEIAPLPSRPRSRRYVVVALFTLALIGLGFAAARFTMRAPAATQWSGVRLGGPDMALNPRLSPDGHLLAFQALVDGQTQVAVMTPESGNWNVLTRRRDRGMAMHLSWSPNGTLIYFSRLTDVPQGVYSVPVLGGEEHLVLENASQPIPLNDGTILLGRVNPQGLKQLFRFTPETGTLQGFPVVFSAELFGYLQILRDGKHVLTRGWTIGQSQEKVAFLEVDLATAAVRRIPDVGVEVRAWTPSADGKSIIVATKAGSLVRVIAMPLDGGTPPQTLFTISDDIWDIDAGADGSVFADLLSRPAGVVRLSPGGGPPEKIAGLPQFPDMDMVVALPDGRAVAPVLVSGRTRLMAVEQGKDPVPLVNTTEETAAPMTVAGPHALAFAIGPLPHHTIAIADTSNGRISGRISPGKGAITSLASTPEGATIYFAAGGAIWSVPAGGGDAHKIAGGEDVMWDPSRHGLVIVRRESSHMTLWRTTLEGGAERQIPMDSAAPLFEIFFSPGTIHPDGRMLVSLNPTDSWFNPPALLDMSSGRVTRLLNNGLTDYHSLAWMPDGKIVATQLGARATIWKFTPANK